MGRRGPVPTPTTLKLLNGNPGRRPLNDREPQFTPAGVKPPAWLTRRAKVEWKRVAPELQAMGMLTTVDQAALASFCTAVSDVEEYTRLINREGRMVRIPLVKRNGDPVTDAAGNVMFVSKPHPALKWLAEAHRQVRAFAAEFGFSPAQRSRVKAGPGVNEDDGVPKARVASRPRDIDKDMPPPPWAKCNQPGGDDAES